MKPENVTPPDGWRLRQVASESDLTKYAPPPKGKGTRIMFPNVKLPHWAFLVLGLASIVIAWIMDQQASGALALPALAITVITIVRSVIGMLTPSVSPSTNVKAVADHQVAIVSGKVQA